MFKAIQDFDFKDLKVHEEIQNSASSNFPINQVGALDIVKMKSGFRRSYEEICETYQNMLAFDWDSREILGLKHPPDKEITAVVMWFYINSLYFPYDA